MTQILLDNRFSVLHLESTSNFSKVVFALDTYQKPPRNCAIKLYKPITQKNQIEQWILREFQKEVSYLKQLSLIEPHLPEIYTYFHDFQGYYLVRELIEGITLREHVINRGVFSPIQVRDILIKLLSTLNKLHQKKIVHQNIKPKNIILRHGDNAPISINFGRIKQIVATFDFHGDKNIFSLKDVRGYVPSEQALGKAIPSSDLYSLGLTAIYLLTEKDPTELTVEINSGQYQIPQIIEDRDASLAKILARATNLNPEERYQSSQEMLNALLISTPNKINYNNSSDRTYFFPNQTDISFDNNKQKNSNFLDFKIIAFAFIIGCLSLANLYLILRYDWNSRRNNSILRIPESPILLPEISSTLPEPSESSVKKTSILNNKLKNALEIPIFTTGKPKKEIRELLGEPNAITKGYWKNSSAWIYKKQANGLIDLGYLFDINTDKLRQTEIAIAPSMGLVTIREILDSLLQGNLDSSTERGLQDIYNGQIKVYSFKSNNLEGSIEVEKDGNIYIGIWEADFH